MFTNSVFGFGLAALAYTGGATLMPPVLGPVLLDAQSSAHPADAADIQLRYRLQMITRDSSGAYVLSGTLKGEEQARATVRLRFEDGSSGRTGTALVHTHWKVLAEPDFKSFEAELRGTLVMVSGQTHLVGTITSGARRSRRVETESRLLDFGVNGQISEVDGLMTIAGR